MSFTGKATYSAGATLPELAEDVADVIGIVSPYETPLLDHLGNAPRPAISTIHEWIEDELLPNSDAIDDATYSNTLTDTSFVVEHGDRFRVGDQIQILNSREVMLVTAISTNTLTVTRGYGGTTAEALGDNQVIRILGNAAIEGDDRPATRFTNRVRRQNYTQIFTSAVEISGSQLAATQLALADEQDYQKAERLREMLRDLENCVINGVAAVSTPQGSSSVRRTMRGIIPSLTSNTFAPGSSGFPAGEGDNDDLLTEAQLNAALRSIWEKSSARIDTIVVNGFQKRRINGFVTSDRRFSGKDTRFRDMVSVYESDFGVCRVILSRWVPTDTVLLLDSSRLHVLPMAGRSFHFKKLAPTGDSEVGMVVGEYTLELRNEAAHGIIGGLGLA